MRTIDSESNKARIVIVSKIDSRTMRLFDFLKLMLMTCTHSKSSDIFPTNCHVKKLLRAKAYKFNLHSYMFISFSQYMTPQNGREN